MPLNFHPAFLAYNFLSNRYQNISMPDKKIITRNDVKENNPNDDEEILKNTDANVPEDHGNDDTAKSENKKERTQGSETIGIP